MSIQLVRIRIKDADKLWTMQVQAFQTLLDKYQDFETNPATETKEMIKNKLLQEHTFFYYIYQNENIVGAIRVVDRKDGSRKRVAPVFILEKFRNQGLAQQAFCEIERIHGEHNWLLDTIFQEKGNCHLYEKLGYERTGELEYINERTSIVTYIKN